MENSWESRPWALVLSGGGAKGSYEIGVWKALRALGIRVEAVAGTSSGALNACLFAQGNLEEAEEAWLSLRVRDIAELPDAAVEELEKPGGKLDALLFLRHRDAFFPKGGIDPAPLRRLVSRLIDERRVRASGLDVGVVSYETTSLRPIEAFLNHIPDGSLQDYLMASAALPGLRSPRIGKREFIDGGLFDNVPTRTLRDRGYRRLIVADVSGIGMKRETDGAGCITAFIRNSISMGHILNFEPGFLRDYMELGRLDTLKVFGELSGTDYFLSPDAALIARLENLLADDTVISSLAPLIGHKSFSVSPADLRTAMRYALPPRFSAVKSPVIPLAECAAVSFGLPRLREYSLSGLLAALQEKSVEAKRPDAEAKGFIDRLARGMSSVLPAHSVNRTPMELYRALLPLTRGDARHPLQGALEALCPELLSGLVFMELLKRL